MTAMTHEIAKLRVDAKSAEQIIRQIVTQLEVGKKTFLVTFVNPGCITYGARNPAYKEALSKFDMVLPDGIALVKILNRRGVKADRISFDSTSLGPHVFAASERLQKTVMLVGGKPGVAAGAAKTLTKAFPNLRIVRTFDGYDDLDAAERFATEQSVDLVICAMGCGAQEDFLLRLQASGWVGCGFTCGGYFDQLGGGLYYYPGWIDKWNVRWIYRLYKEPRRLWRRYFIQYGIFVLLLLQDYVRASVSLSRKLPSPHTALSGEKDTRLGLKESGS